ncbi:hypothetical protein Enr13x_24270 [Stieleria neptunia]|uniref:Type I restriction enzyme HindI endonuclease subunit-like C-terminal domain-containing protein n=1 Tax=Stieleria neptunia TaxID=2527979 RepID=A0A518HP07_9BACT|nr:hypothetical protein Enr13x_24270 [Stieleria neptunia]
MRLFLRYNPAIMPLDMIKLGNELRAAVSRWMGSGLFSISPVTINDAVADGVSEFELLGDDKLNVIATELFATVRKNATID